VVEVNPNDWHCILLGGLMRVGRYSEADGSRILVSRLGKGDVFAYRNTIQEFPKLNGEQACEVARTFMYGSIS